MNKTLIEIYIYTETFYRDIFVLRKYIVIFLQIMDKTGAKDAKCALSNGSVIATFDITFEVKTNSSSAPVNFTKVIEEKIVKGGKIGNFSFDPASFVVKKVSVAGR